MLWSILDDDTAAPCSCGTKGTTLSNKVLLSPSAGVWAWLHCTMWSKISKPTYTLTSSIDWGDGRGFVSCGTTQFNKHTDVFKPRGSCRADLWNLATVSWFKGKVSRFFTQEDPPRDSWPLAFAAVGGKKERFKSHVCRWAAPIKLNLNRKWGWHNV